MINRYANARVAMNGNTVLSVVGDTTIVLHAVAETLAILAEGPHSPADQGPTVEIRY